MSLKQSKPFFFVSVTNSFEQRYVQLVAPKKPTTTESLGNQKAPKLNIFIKLLLYNFQYSHYRASENILM